MRQYTRSQSLQRELFTSISRWSGAWLKMEDYVSTLASDEVNDIHTRYEFKVDHRSYTHNLSSCEIEAWKKFRPERDSNPRPLSYQAIWELVILWVRNIPVESEECQLIYEIYISTFSGIADVMGSNPVQAWIFFRLKFHNCLSHVYNCDDQL